MPTDLHPHYTVFGSPLGPQLSPLGPYWLLGAAATDALSLETLDLLATTSTNTKLLGRLALDAGVVRLGMVRSGVVRLRQSLAETSCECQSNSEASYSPAIGRRTSRVRIRRIRQQQHKNFRA